MEITLFVVSIGIITLVGWGLQIKQIIHYGKEQGWINQLTSYFTGPGMGIKASGLEILKYNDVPPSSMAGSRVCDVEAFAEYPGMVALHDLGSAAIDADAARPSNVIPNVLIGSLLVVGLCGTLWSLQETLTSPELTKFVKKDGGTDAASFQEALGPVLEGFGSAFSASIAGVVGTIFLIAFRIIVRNQRETCFSQLENFAVRSLLPHFITPAKDQLSKATKSLEESLAALNQAENTLSEQADTSTEVTGSFNSLLTDTAQLFGTNGVIASRMKEFAEATEFKQKQTNDLLNTSIAQSISTQKSVARQVEVIERLEALTSEIKDVATTSLESQKEALQNNERQTKKLDKLLRSQLNELVKSQNAIGQALETQPDQHTDIVTRIGAEVSKSYGDTLENLRENLEGHVNSLNRISTEEQSRLALLRDTHITQLDKMTEKLETIAIREDRIDIESLNELKSFMKSLGEKLEESFNNFFSVVQEISDSQQQLKIESEQSSTKVNEGASALKEAANSLIKLNDAAQPKPGRGGFFSRR